MRTSYAMLVDHEREKLINAILYFAQSTKHVGKIKLFKLLYLLDFEHFRQTGRSVTGLTYTAWKFGPVPVQLMQEWEEPQPDFRSVVSIRPEQIYDYWRQTVVPDDHAVFDDSHFTKRELRLMKELANKFRDECSPEMIDVTHAENGAWAKVWHGGLGMNNPIDYELALAETDPHRDAVLEAAHDYQATRQSAGHHQ